MARGIVGRDGGTRQDVAPRGAATVIDRPSDVPPHVGHELPLVDEAGPVALQKDGRVEAARGACRGIRLQVDLASGNPPGGRRLATGAGPLDQHGPTRAEQRLELGVDDARAIVDVLWAHLQRSYGHRCNE